MVNHWFNTETGTTACGEHKGAIGASVSVLTWPYVSCPDCLSADYPAISAKDIEWRAIALLDSASRSEHLVHNHDYDPSCGEFRFNGRLVGACIAHESDPRVDLESPGSNPVGDSATDTAKGPQISETLKKLGMDDGPTEDPVNSPSHYRWLPVEAIDINENFNFNMGNALKYIMRADHKGKPIEDLRKSLYYIKRELKRRGYEE